MLANIDRCLGFKTYLLSETTTGLELLELHITQDAVKHIIDIIL